jgi:hypothetical protein
LPLNLKARVTSSTTILNANNSKEIEFILSLSLSLLFNKMDLKDIYAAAAAASYS